MSKEIESAIGKEDWDSARDLIRRALRSRPNSHWLITRLGLTYYEQRQYKLALRYSEKALRLAPSCPLVLWDYAGTLDMLDRPEEAMQVFRRLIGRGIERIAKDECGEGVAWARGLVADCHYRLALCLADQGQCRKAREELQRHLAVRGPGCRSIYQLKDVRSKLQELNMKSHN